MARSIIYEVKPHSCLFPYRPEVCILSTQTTSCTSFVQWKKLAFQRYFTFIFSVKSTDSAVDTITDTVIHFFHGSEMYKINVTIHEISQPQLIDHTNILALWRDDWDF